MFDSYVELPKGISTKKWQNGDFLYRFRFIHGDLYIMIYGDEEMVISHS